MFFATPLKLGPLVPEAFCVHMCFIIYTMIQCIHSIQCIKLLYSVETAVMVLAQDSQENVVRDGQSGGGVNVKVFERFLRYCINRSSTCVSVERTACTNNWQM